jgi:ABC-type antimicrobial peptide transport system permease subunit
VVGVVGNASTTAVANPEPLEFYLPQLPSDVLDSILLVRVSDPSHDFLRPFQDAARALDKRLQPAVRVVSDAYDGEVKNTRRALAAIAILGSLAIALSSIGLTGLAGFTVARRTREIGVRIALGARATHIARAILAPMSRAIVSGFVLGALGGSAVARVLRSAMPAMAGISVFDPLAYLAAVAFFAVVVALSILAPGRRAIRIDPSKALQNE